MLSTSSAPAGDAANCGRNAPAKESRILPESNQTASWPNNSTVFAEAS